MPSALSSVEFLPLLPEAETAAADRVLERKRERRDAREREEEVNGPRAIGKERMLEKKAERRANDRAFRERGDEGLEVDEATLMGGGSFQQECVTEPIVCCG